MNWFYIFKGDGNALYSPQFARQGLVALFACYIHQILNSPTLTITIGGRSDEATAWSSVGTFASITTAGNKTSSQSALPQLLRFKFEVTGASEMSGVAIQLLNPQWRD